MGFFRFHFDGEPDGEVYELIWISLVHEARELGWQGLFYRTKVEAAGLPAEAQRAIDIHGWERGRRELTSASAIACVEDFEPGRKLTPCWSVGKLDLGPSDVGEENGEGKGNR
jgi:hypothetical protein